MPTRRGFLYWAAGTPLAQISAARAVPSYRVTTPYPPATKPGMPGPFPGKVVSVHSDKSIDEASERIDAGVVREMMARGMCELTGERRPEDACRRIFGPEDDAGIKLTDRIYLYERFKNQVDNVNYPPHLPQGVHIVTAEQRRGDNSAYDPRVYVEASFFGEEDTRSNAMSVVTRKVTKIINVPNMKDHGASGVTG
mgnify:CR=1 FL=1